MTELPGFVVTCEDINPMEGKIQFGGHDLQYVNRVEVDVSRDIHQGSVTLRAILPTVDVVCMWNGREVRVICPRVKPYTVQVLDLQTGKRIHGVSRVRVVIDVDEPNYAYINFCCSIMNPRTDIDAEAEIHPRDLGFDCASLQAEWDKFTVSMGD